MSAAQPMSKAAKWKVGAAITAALIAAAPLLIPQIKGCSGQPKGYISGTVFDAGDKTQKLSNIVVQLQTDEGKALTQATTDSQGTFSLEIPAGLTTVRLVASVKGYSPYDRKLPAAATRNDIYLERLGKTFGIAPDSQLEGALQKIAGKLNVTVVFSEGCTSKARRAKLGGGEIHEDTSAPEVVLKAVLDEVTDSSLQYRIIALEPGRRYEVGCH